jgi:uncharacterized protein
VILVKSQSLDVAAEKMEKSNAPQLNSRTALEARARHGDLTLFGPMLMVFARLILAYLAQALVARLYAWQAHPNPWLAAAPWFTVTGTLIDLGSLGLLAWLARLEGIRLVDLLSLERGQLRRDLLLAPVITIILLIVGITSGAVSAMVLYGNAPPPQIMGPLPVWGALYSVLVWPLIWGTAEQLTYNGYAAPRLQVLMGRTWLAVLITCVGYGLQHIALPSLPDLQFALYRFLPAFALGLVMVPLYLRWRRLLPFIIAHWFVDTLSALTQVLLPLIS